MNRRTIIATWAASALLAATGKAQAANGIQRVVIFNQMRPEAIADDRLVVIPLFASHGFVEGRNLKLEYVERVATPGELEAKAREIVASRPDLICVGGIRFASLFRRLTGEIPIVFFDVSDPVRNALVASIPRPGGNVTGTSNREVELLGKRLELLMELRPGKRRLGVLVPDGEAGDLMREDLAAVSRRLGWKPVEITRQLGAPIEAVLEAIASARPDALVVTGANRTLDSRLRTYLVSAAMPAVFSQAAVVTQGGLLSLGIDDEDLNRRTTEMMVRILRGAKPSQIPVDELSRVVLALNLRTATEMRLVVPQSIRQRADVVIE